MADVFISYSQKDRAIAARLAEVLKARGLTVWWDADMIGGESFRSAILEQLELSKIALVLWSTNSVGSRFVLDEADRAAATGKLISLLVAEFPPKYIPVGFGSFQAVPIEEQDRVMRALEVRGLLPPATPGAPQIQADNFTLEHTAWTFVQERNDPKLLEEFLTEFPKGKFTFMARRRLAEMKWQKLSTSNETAAIESFCLEHPNSEFVAEARSRIEALKLAEAARAKQERMTGARVPLAQEKRAEATEKPVHKIREAPKEKQTVGKWRVIAWGATGLLLVVSVGLYQMGVLSWAPRPEQPDAHGVDNPKAAAEAEAKRKAAEAEQQRVAAAKAEEERNAKAAAEAEAKRKAAEAEQQRLKEAAEAEQRRLLAGLSPSPLIAGTWSGELAQVDSKRPYKFQVVIGPRGAETTYPDLDCTGKLTRVGASESYVFFVETITKGAADKGGRCPDGTITATRLGNFLLLFWFGSHYDRTVVAYGRLAKN
jgi:TIR domain